MIKLEGISILCPSRGRPELFERMVESAISNAAHLGTRILAYVDDDDDMREGYYEVARRYCKRVVVHVGPPFGVGKAWNSLAGMAGDSLLMMGNDDIVFMTPEWDAKILKAIEATGDAAEDGIFVAWADDGMPNPKDRCTFPIVHRRWVDVLGYFTPECFHFLWHDTWVGDLGSLVDRKIFVDNVVAEHRHFSFKKAPYDETYRRHRVGPDNTRKRNQDRAQYAATVNIRRADADKLRLVMTGENNDTTK